jgi:glycosyltransferase involved in cell wall biosynthesis
LKSLAIKHENIVIIRNDENRGAAFSRNKCLELARGEYIAFLDADDAWFPVKVERQVYAMASSGADFCYTSYWQVPVQGAGKDAFLRKCPAAIKKHHFFFGSPCGLSTVLCHSSLIANTRFPDLKRRQDYAFWMLLYQRSAGTIGVQEPLVLWFFGNKKALSAKKMRLPYYNYLALREGLRISRAAALICVLLTTASVLARRVLPTRGESARQLLEESGLVCFAPPLTETGEKPTYAA